VMIFSGSHMLEGVALITNFKNAEHSKFSYSGESVGEDSEIVFSYFLLAKYSHIQIQDRSVIVSFDRGEKSGLLREGMLGSK